MIDITIIIVIFSLGNPANLIYHSYDTYKRLNQSYAQRSIVKECYNGIFMMNSMADNPLLFYFTLK